MRRLSDPWLLLVRVLIVALAAAAAAQPVFLTPGRLAGWNQRVARAIVIDTSGAGGDDAPAAQAREEAASAFASTVIEAPDLRRGVAAAAAWLASAPPARRELVIISDGRAGAIPLDIARQVPDASGIRAVAVGELPAERTYQGPDVIGDGRVPQVRLTPDATHVSWIEAAGSTEGLRIEGVGEAEASFLARVAAGAGAPALRADRPVLLTFEASRLAALEPIQPGWMLAAVGAMAADEDLAHAARATAAAALPGDAAHAVVVARGTDGRALARASRIGETLVLQVATGPRDLLSAAVLVAALRASHGGAARPGFEVVRMAAGDLARLAREPAPVDASLVGRADRSDARWLWLAVLVLLGLEAWARRPRPDVRREAPAHAA